MVHEEQGAVEQGSAENARYRHYPNLVLRDVVRDWFENRSDWNVRQQFWAL